MATKVEYKGYTLEFPDNATDDDIHKYIQENESQFDSIAPAKQEAPKQEDDGLLGSLKRIDLNAGTNIANIPSAVADSVASAGAWLGGKLGIGDGTYIPAPRFEVGEEDKPRGIIEEVASEAIPYLIPVPATAGVKAAGVGERVANALARNASQSVVGSAANNSDGEIGANFAADVVLNAGVGAGIEKVASSAGNLIKAGSQRRRAVMDSALQTEKNAIKDIKEASRELNAINGTNRLFEEGIESPDGVRIPSTLGEIQDYVNTLTPGAKEEFAFDKYLSRVTDGRYTSGDAPLPEAVRSLKPNADVTRAIEDQILREVKGNFNKINDSGVGGVSQANQFIRDSRSGINRLNPSVSVGGLPSDVRRNLGLNSLESLVSRIGDLSEKALPLDASYGLRYGSSKAVDRGQQSLRNEALEKAAREQASLDDRIVKAASDGGSVDKGVKRAIEGQINAFDMVGHKSFAGVDLDKISRDDLINLLTSTSQQINRKADVVTDAAVDSGVLKPHDMPSFRDSARNLSASRTRTPVDIASEIGESAKAVKYEPLNAGSVGSIAASYLTGGISSLGQAVAALPNLALSRSISRDLARLDGQVFRGDATRNAIGEGLEEGAKRMNTGTYDQVDLELDNDKKIEQLDDWATKNGISQEILSEAVRIKGADLGSLKGINSIKGLALDLDAKARAEDTTLSVGEGYNPNHTLATRQISQAMAEAMYGLSDDEKEAIIDDYLDSVHFEEDEKLVGLKLQRAIQKAVKHALDKSS